METHLHILTVIDNCSHCLSAGAKKKYRQLLFLSGSLMVVFICFYDNRAELEYAAKSSFRSRDTQCQFGEV